MFKSGWRDCPDDWHCPQLAAEFVVLRQVRDLCNKALDLARSDQLIGSSLEATATVTTNSSRLITLMSKTFSQPSAEGEASYSLGDFLTVSEATTGFSEQAHGGPGSYTAEGCVNLDGTSGSVRVSVQKAQLHKCPRCWRHLAAIDSHLCNRCDHVVARQELVRVKQ